MALSLPLTEFAILPVAQVSGVVGNSAAVFTGMCHGRSPFGKSTLVVMIIICNDKRSMATG
jgi:hypothetical protein